MKEGVRHYNANNGTEYEVYWLYLGCFVKSWLLTPPPPPPTPYSDSCICVVIYGWDGIPFLCSFNSFLTTLLISYIVASNIIAKTLRIVFWKPLQLVSTRDGLDCPLCIHLIQLDYYIGSHMNCCMSHFVTTCDKLTTLVTGNCTFLLSMKVTS